MKNIFFYEGNEKIKGKRKKNCEFFYKNIIKKELYINNEEISVNNIKNSIYCFYYFYIPKIK